MFMRTSIYLTASLPVDASWAAWPAGSLGESRLLCAAPCLLSAASLELSLLGSSRSDAGVGPGEPALEGNVLLLPAMDGPLAPVVCTCKQQ